MRWLLSEQLSHWLNMLASMSCGLGSILLSFTCDVKVSVEHCAPLRRPSIKWLIKGRNTELTLLTGADICVFVTCPLALWLTNLPLQYTLDKGRFPFKKIGLDVNLTTHLHWQSIYIPVVCIGIVRLSRELSVTICNWSTSAYYLIYLLIAHRYDLATQQ